MPELVAEGPIVPVRLMNDLDSGKIVFFCGAGNSAGPGSELRGVERLVEHLYTANRMALDSVESEAPDWKSKIAADAMFAPVAHEKRWGSPAGGGAYAGVGTHTTT